MIELTSDKLNIKLAKFLTVGYYLNENTWYLNTPFPESVKRQLSQQEVTALLITEDVNVALTEPYSHALLFKWLSDLISSIPFRDSE